MRMHSSLSPLLFGLTLSGLAVAQVPVGNAQRADLAEQLRIDAARFQRSQPLPAHPNNGDEQRYPSRFANYSKGLPHDSTGTVEPTAYQKMLLALGTGNPADFEAIPLGGTRKLVNPQSAYSFTLVGPDPHALAIRPAPAYASAETAGEMEELYWMSLVRDVDFYQYPSAAVTVAAAQRLNNLPHYRGAKADGARVTANLLFRANVGGALNGPFISQFLLKPIPYGAGPFASGPREPVGYQLLEQRNLERRRGDDRMTQYEEWLNIQNGQVPTLNGGLIDQLEGTNGTRLYLHNARGLAEYVHNDYPIQATLSAALLLLRQGDFLPDGSYEPDPKSSPLAMASWNPYLSYVKQEAFVTLASSDTLSVSTLVTNTALRAAWYQKWLVHRRLRPEEFGGHVDNQLFNRRTYPIHPELLASPVLARVFNNNTALNSQRGLPGGGTYLLSQTFPEGAPLHPAYGSGHSTYIGAGVTMLKAFHKDFPIRNPQETSNGSGLQPYTGGTLMVFDELDKLASNIGVARLFAGVHWRSDHDSAVRLGELFALRTLQDLTRTYNEQFPSFNVRTFSGETLTITPTSSLPGVVSSVESFSLIDAATGQAVPGYAPLENGKIIDLSTLAGQGITQPVIQATTYPSVVGSVRFVLDGATSADNSVPYAVGMPLGLGEHAVYATPYSGASASGLGGIPLSIRFTVQN
ncbi:hypothetical protein [Cystobacter fuscus]|uniref:hypothetical protein n=1 Tax=Cystobacter fuscus TaxID=43 RepID=UPI002B320AA4|nr:hypothetical protein F0U63_13425 [Cystobacter fuscus]